MTAFQGTKGTIPCDPEIEWLVMPEDRGRGVVTCRLRVGADFAACKALRSDLSVRPDVYAAALRKAVADARAARIADETSVPSDAPN